MLAFQLLVKVTQLITESACVWAHVWYVYILTFRLSVHVCYYLILTAVLQSNIISFLQMKEHTSVICEWQSHLGAGHFQGIFFFFFVERNFIITVPFRLLGALGEMTAQKQRSWRRAPNLPVRARGTSANSPGAMLEGSGETHMSHRPQAPKVKLADGQL